MKLLNAFSLNMISADCTVEIKRISENRVAGTAYDGCIESYIGHKQLSDILSDRWRVEIPMNRDTVTLDSNGERVFIAQYKGPRLPEGTTEIPDGAKIEFFAVEIK